MQSYQVQSSFEFETATTGVQSYSAWANPHHYSFVRNDAEQKDSAAFATMSDCCMQDVFNSHEIFQPNIAYYNSECNWCEGSSTISSSTFSSHPIASLYQVNMMRNDISFDNDNMSQHFMISI